MRNVMIRCNRCDSIFDESELITDYVNGGDIGEPHNSCPYCGHDDWDEVKECCRCGRWFSVDELHGYSGWEMCRDCIEDETDTRTVIEYGDTVKQDVSLNGFLSDVFSDEEINEILTSKFMELPESKQKEAYTEFVNTDLDEYAGWLA